MLRFITNIFALPLIRETYYQKLYIDMIVFIMTFIGSSLFHFQELLNQNKIFLMSYWKWLIYDIHTSMAMVTIVITHITHFNNFKKLFILNIFSFINTFINLILLEFKNGLLLDLFNLIQGLSLCSFIFFKYNKIKLTIIEKYYYIISYAIIIFLIRFIPLSIEFTHSLWHIAIFTNTLFLYKSLESDYI